MTDDAYPDRVYVLLEVGIHGLSRAGRGPDLDEVVRRARQAIVAEFRPERDDDIEVEPIESAGLDPIGPEVHLAR